MSCVETGLERRFISLEQHFILVRRIFFRIFIVELFYFHFMRVLLSLLLAMPIAVSAQLCSEPSPVSYSGFGPQLTQADLSASGDYLDGLNTANFSLGTGISDNNLCIQSNSDITTFLGVKLRNTTAPNDNTTAAGNAYFVEPGFSPDTQNGEAGAGPFAKWNVIAYAGLNAGAFDSVDVIVHLDFDPCFSYVEEDLLAINIGDELDNNILTSSANVSSFGINTNLAYASIDALNNTDTPFDANTEGYYTFAIEIKDNCGNRKLWNEITVYVQSETTSTGGAVADANENGVYDDNELTGCQNQAACNFDCTATTNAGCDYTSCSGCTVEQACNYNSTATVANTSECNYPIDLWGAYHFNCDGSCVTDADQDGVCDEDEVVGCQDENACNYTSSATDAGACDYAMQYYDCSDVCLNDSDEDGVCDELEVTGCMSSTACNYDANATDDDGSCEYLSCAGCAVAQACNYDSTATISSATCLFAGGCDACSGEVDGTGTVLSGDSDGDGVCNEDEIFGCTNSESPNFSIQATEDDDSCIEVSYGCLIPIDCNYDATAAYMDITMCSPGNGGSTACAGDMIGGSPLPLGMITTCEIASACNYGEEGSCEWSSCIGCMNPDGCDYDENNLYPTACDYACYGCTNSLADNYDGSATSDDGSCVLSGCMAIVACNFNSDATTDDGSCEYDSCAGCMEASACNFDPTASLNLTLTCVFPETNYDCAGNCINDTDSDGVCDEFEIGGCMDVDACNFNATATDNDSSCTYPASEYVDCSGACLVDEDEDGVCDPLEVFGCDLDDACNYNPSATENDGSCEFVSCAGCTIESACNYDETATLSNNASCTYIPEGWDDCDQTICTDSDSDGNCDFDEPAGCIGEFNAPVISMNGMVETAADLADWSSTDFLIATSDDTGMEGITFTDYPGRLNDGRYSVTRVYSATDICGNTSEAGQLIVADASHAEGCTNPNATSYDADAINDDGSCDYSPACLGDLNLDSIVGTSDLLILLSSFGLPCAD